MSSTLFEPETMVEADLFGKADEAASQWLHGNLESWRGMLTEKLTDIDQQFQSRRAKMLEDRTTEAKIAYEKWKRSALGRKQAIVSRIQEVKSKIKYRNIDEHVEQERTHDEILKLILAELKQINQKLGEVHD